MGKEVWLLNRFLNWSLTEGSGIRKADGRSVISRVAINNVGRDLAFDFIRDKWDRVVDYYGSTSFAMAGLMKNVLSRRNTGFLSMRSKDLLMKMKRPCLQLKEK